MNWKSFVTAGWIAPNVDVIAGAAPPTVRNPSVTVADATAAHRRIAPPLPFMPPPFGITTVGCTRRAACLARVSDESVRRPSEVSAARARVAPNRGRTKGGVAMPHGGWSAKRERQYKHIKSGLRKRGASEGRAEEIA